MLQVNGTLTVKKIHGAKGAFSVGDLVTEVGTFKIKDALLDQFEEGRYQGPSPSPASTCPPTSGGASR
jgi:hypothetical protein